MEDLIVKIIEEVVEIVVRKIVDFCLFIGRLFGKKNKRKAAKRFF